MNSCSKLVKITQVSDLVMTTITRTYPLFCMNAKSGVFKYIYKNFKRNFYYSSH